MVDPLLLNSAAVLASLVLSVLGILVSIKLAKSERHKHLWIAILVFASAACVFTVWGQYKASLVAIKEKADLNLQKAQAEKRQLELQLDLERTQRIIEILDSKVDALVLSLPSAPTNRSLLELSSAVKTLMLQLPPRGSTPPRKSWQPPPVSLLDIKSKQVFMDDPPPTQAFTVADLPREIIAVRPPTPSRCDLNGDGKVDALDVQIAIERSLGAKPCPASEVTGCNVLSVQRVLMAAQFGGACRIGI